MSSEAGTGEPRFTDVDSRLTDADSRIAAAELRIADVDRERASTLLASAMEHGRITPAEFSERCRDVWAARTRAELVAPLADLPGGPPPDLAPLVLDVAFGRVWRTGDWAVPELVRVAGVGQRTLLDFTDALVRHPEITVEITGHLSSTRLVLPPAAEVDTDGLELVAGAVRYRGPGGLTAARARTAARSAGSRPSGSRGRLRRLLPGGGPATEPEPPPRVVLRGRATLAGVMLWYPRAPRRR